MRKAESMDIEDMKGIVMSRRSALKRTGGVALLLSQATLLEQVALAPARPAFAASFSDIQFSVGQFMPAGTYAGVGVYNDGAGPITASFGPIYTTFTPIRLTPEMAARHMTPGKENIVHEDAGG